MAVLRAGRTSWAISPPTLLNFSFFSWGWGLWGELNFAALHTCRLLSPENIAVVSKSSPRGTRGQLAALQGVLDSPEMGTIGLFGSR